MTFRRHAPWLVSAAMFLVTMTARAADTTAAEACRSDAPKIRIDATVPAGIRQELLVQLRATLRPRGIEVCAGEASPAAVAVVELTADSETHFTVAIKDALYAKRVERDVDLAKLPPDGRPLALALTIDELLRASWAEMLLVDAKPVESVPPEIQRAVTPSQPAWKSVELGASFSAEHYTGGRAQLGGGAFVTFWARPWLGLQARAGMRTAEAVDTPRGEVQATALVLGAGPLVALARHGRLGLDVGARLTMVRTNFSAEADAPIRAHEATGTALYVEGGPRGWFALHPSVRAVVDIGIGAPLHSVHALDGDARVTGVGGLQLALGIGAAAVF